jgi:signal transduction histidine kinase
MTIPLFDESATDHDACVRDLSQCKRATAELGRVNEALERQLAERTASLRTSEDSATSAARALGKSERELRALVAGIESLRERERGDLAREIHDVLGQGLTGLKMDAAWILRRMAAANEPGDVNGLAESRLQTMLGQIDLLVDTVHRIATDLRPGVLDDLGLVDALEWQAREFRARSGLAVVLKLPGGELAIDKGRATAIFRIFQELLTNVARHTGARSIDAALLQEPGALVLQVRDDGRGITEREIASASSLGLIGIRERACAFGGELSMVPAEGGGTRACVRIPLGSSEASEPIARG